MGTILCSKIIDDVERELGDSSNGRWSAANHFINLKLAQKKIAELKPDVSVYTGASTVALSEGTKQSLASVYTTTKPYQLLDIRSNLGTDGETAGSAITYIDIKVMDKMVPNWRTTTPSATVIHWLYDEKYPDTFWVYPPQPSSGQNYVDLSCYTIPADPASADSAITLNDIWEGALFQWMLHLSHNENKAHSVYGYQRSIDAKNEFYQLLGRKDLLEQKEAPTPTE